MTRTCFVSECFHREYILKFCRFRFTFLTAAVFMLIPTVKIYEREAAFKIRPCDHNRRK